MTTDITPGWYRNTNTSAEFTVEQDDDEVIMREGRGETLVTIRRDAGNFWFNTLDATGPTYELLSEAPEHVNVTEIRVFEDITAIRTPHVDTDLDELVELHPETRNTVGITHVTLKWPEADGKDPETIGIYDYLRHYHDRIETTPAQNVEHAENSSKKLKS